MLYYDFKGEKLSKLGFGGMRLPVKDGAIDTETLQTMVDYALEQGVNYFDTSYSYHNGASEGALTAALSKHPRDSYYLADKFPGHEHRNVYRPAEIFQEQVDRCNGTYFDYYLAHNVTEYSLPTYLDKRWGIMDYLIEQKAAGRIRHLGFSAHGRLDTIKAFMDAWGDHIEFCQLQINPLDWTLQNAQDKYSFVTEAGIPVWVMEPLRGGMLCSFPEDDEAALRALRPNEDDASLAFRWLQRLDNVGVILSGMSTMDMLAKNVATFTEHRPLTDQEAAVLKGVADKLVDAVPCTGCRYCAPHCPLELDIPNLISLLNDGRAAMRYTTRMGIDALPEEKRPGACIGCRSCVQMCPQNIDIPALMEELQVKADKLMPWAELRKYD